jgi:TRAP-type transport system small permease protein
MKGETMERVQKLMRHVDRITLTLLKAVCILCFILLTVLVSANVVVRFLPVVSLHWFDEIVEMLYAYLVFYGAAALWINSEHFRVGDWMSGRIIKSAAASCIYRLTLELLKLIFAGIFLYYSFRLTILAIDVTNVFAIPKRVLYSCMPISALIMVVYSLCNVALQVFKMGKWEDDGLTKMTRPDH